LVVAGTGRRLDGAVASHSSRVEGR
jgi:hypothetical protein